MVCLLLSQPQHASNEDLIDLSDVWKANPHNVAKKIQHG